MPPPVGQQILAIEHYQDIMPTRFFKYDLIWPLYPRPWVGIKLLLLPQSWIGQPQKKNSAVHIVVPTHKIWSQYLNPVPSYDPIYVSTIYGGQLDMLNRTTSTKSHRFLFEVPTHKIWIQYLKPVQSNGQKQVLTIYGVSLPSWIGRCQK